MILSCIECRKTEKKGWGIFTTIDIPEGVIIERSPVIVMSDEEKVLLEKTKLYHYIFDWEDDQCCMAMGNVPIYNHASPSNCEYFQDYESQEIFIKTMRPISADEELTINYTGVFDSKEEVWFPVV